MTTSLENVGAELAQVRREKDNIGDSIRGEFDDICSRLRMDPERALKERHEIARVMEVGRLGLEKQLLTRKRHSTVYSRLSRESRASEPGTVYRTCNLGTKARIG